MINYYRDKCKIITNAWSAWWLDDKFNREKNMFVICSVFSLSMWQTALCIHCSKYTIHRLLICKFKIHNEQNWATNLHDNFLFFPFYLTRFLFSNPLAAVFLLCEVMKSRTQILAFCINLPSLFLPWNCQLSRVTHETYEWVSMASFVLL